MNHRKREVHERFQTTRIIFLSIAVKIARKRPIMYRQRIANLANENAQIQPVRVPDSTQVKTVDRALGCNFLFVLSSA